MKKVVISLGSNMGDSREILERAIFKISHILNNVKVSSMIETSPWGGVEQPNFLNAVLIGEFDSDALTLLKELHKIEIEENRVREIKWGPRTLDLDIITFEGTIIEGDELTLPHPRAHERAFVLEPWLEIDPNGEIPHRGYIRDLLELLH